MTSRNLGHVRTRRKTLGNDRDLFRFRPFPPVLRPRDHLDPPRPPHGRVITTVKHKVKSIPSRQATVTDHIRGRNVGAEQRLPSESPFWN